MIPHILQTYFFTKKQYFGIVKCKHTSRQIFGTFGKQKHDKIENRFKWIKRERNTNKPREQAAFPKNNELVRTKSSFLQDT